MNLHAWTFHNQQKFTDKNKLRNVDNVKKKPVT